MGPYKLIRLPERPNLNLNLIKCNRYTKTITIRITLEQSYHSKNLTYKTNPTAKTNLIITTNVKIGNLTVQYSKHETVTL